MRIDSVIDLLEGELVRVTDSVRREKLKALLVPPRQVSLPWDYGRGGERFDCWHVGQSQDGGTWLVYCEQGFGPAFPWGFVFPAFDSLGMDSQWHVSLEDAAIGAGLLDAPDGYEVPGVRE
jgi:hypothetical protein